MRRKKRQDQCGTWINTYGDMVTLLLCFFVLLYAISAVDQTKWSNFVKSVNPDMETQTEAQMMSQEYETAATEKFDDLYDDLKAEVDKRNLNAEIAVKKGDGYTFISFKDNIFFGGDSYILKAEGESILYSFSDIIRPYAKEIGKIEVLGHTADVQERSSTVNDRFLSSNRATAVVVYLQDKDIVDAGKLVSMGYGKYWPVGDNSTQDGRAANRRVELLITKAGGSIKSLNDFYGEMNEK